MQHQPGTPKRDLDPAINTTIILGMRNADLLIVKHQYTLHARPLLLRTSCTASMCQQAALLNQLHMPQEQLA